MCNHSSITLKDDGVIECNLCGTEMGSGCVTFTSNPPMELVSSCPFCQARAPLVEIHGHHQCGVCKQVVVRCCEGEQA